MKKILIIIITFTMLAVAQENSLKFGGYLETKLSCMIADDEITSSNTLFRLETSYDIGDKGKMEAHLLYNYDLQPVDPFSSFKENSIYSKIMGENLYFDIDPNSLSSTERVIYDYLVQLFEDNTSTYLPYSSYYPKETMIIDRALVKLYFGNSDFIIGKQQIAWGTGYAYNPTDIWNIKDPMNATAGKIGVLALNLETYFGENSSLNLIASPGSNFDHWRYGFRVKSNTGRFDYSVLAIRDKTDDGEIMGFPEKILLGADFAGEIISEIGWWGEVAVINPRYDGMEYSDTDSIYIQTASGFDYTFDNGVYCMAEYYYNALGDNDYKDYDISSIGLSTAGAMSGFAQNYLATVISYSFRDKYTASLFNITNLDDISSVLIPELSYDFHENIQIKLNSNIFMGSRERTEYGGMYSSVMFSVIGYF
ncbi:MAG: hypothetical protein JXR69_10170 [Candidatus Delongbacteria bacterium]|nr:hypothetical protein [Candidatus Delongbacteria bacterium]